MRVASAKGWLNLWNRACPYSRKPTSFFVGLALSWLLTTAAVAAGEHDWRDFDGLISKSQHEMMADPVAALKFARHAEAIAHRHRGEPRQAEASATSLWLEAEALIRINRVAEAQNAAMTASKLAASDKNLTKLDGDLALTRAQIAENRGDVALSLKNYQDAHATYQKLGKLRSQAIALQGLGRIYDKAHDFGAAIRYYREASQIYPDDRALALSAANNLGFALLQIARYREALLDFRRALKIASDLKSHYLEAQILTNIAAVQTKLHNLAEAEHAANRALYLLGKDDEIGGTPFVWGIKAQIDYERGSLQAASKDLAKAFHAVNLSTTIAPFRDIHEIAYKVYRDQGNLPLALAHLEAFKRLDDRGRSLAASANLALTSARFDFARQQLEIEHLRSAQLERDVSLRKSRAATQNAVFAAFVLAGIFLIAWITWRHSLLNRHRNAIAEKNVELTRTLAERDSEIERRSAVETQLRLAMEAAQQANRAKSQFLANMSHELRTPLNAIIGFSELLVAGQVRQEKIREYAGDIAESGRRLLQNLNDILDMARIEAGRVTLEESSIRLADIVDQAISALEEKCAGKNIRRPQQHGELLVRVDEHRLRQIVVNLLSNAIKFTGENGRIEIDIRTVEDGVDLLVADNGKGIPAEKIDVIMEPFGQAENTYARTHGGVGLGLPIVRALAEMHDGTFTISSDGHGGTVARIHLPLSRIIEEPLPNMRDDVPARSLTTTVAA
ncbi:MAG: tetratricopeptide repeat protein [Alphaproteobacteria bacterium]|nr:tetratricopeptide repeat protein [Alphaproteobacteria bacterium]